MYCVLVTVHTATNSGYKFFWFTLSGITLSYGDIPLYSMMEKYHGTNLCLTMAKLHLRAKTLSSYRKSLYHMY